MGNLVDEATVRTFERDGAVLIRSLVDESTLAPLRVAVDAAMARSENYFRRLRVWESDADCRAFCLHSPAPALAAELMHSDKINLFYDQVFAKEAGAGPTPWHNDQPYWPVRGQAVMTVWLALDTVTFDSGPLEFIAGSHRWGRWFQPFLAASDGSIDRFHGEDDPDFEPLPDFDAERDQHRILSWEMQAGDAVCFHALTVHGACANHSENRRRGYAVRYTGAGAAYYLGPGVNPRITNEALQPGQPMDSAQYPVAYRRTGA